MLRFWHTDWTWIHSGKRGRDRVGDSIEESSANTRLARFGIGGWLVLVRCSKGSFLDGKIDLSTGYQSARPLRSLSSTLFAIQYEHMTLASFPGELKWSLPQLLNGESLENNMPHPLKSPRRNEVDVHVGISPDLICQVIIVDPSLHPGLCKIPQSPALRGLCSRLSADPSAMLVSSGLLCILV